VDGQPDVQVEEVLALHLLLADAPQLLGARVHTSTRRSASRTVIREMGASWIRSWRPKMTDRRSSLENT
jgi:hypothetical protein